jgi:hypothetical protein
MTKSVIDFFEFVEIDEKERQLQFVTLGMG